MSVQSLSVMIPLLSAGILLTACDRAASDEPAPAIDAPAAVDPLPAAANLDQQLRPAPRTPAAGALPADLQTQIDRYKQLVNAARHQEAVDAIRITIPELEEHVRKHPQDPEANLELSGAYLTYMLVLAKSIPPGPEMLAAFMEGVQRDYLGKARSALAVFERNTSASDPRRAAATELRSWIDEIEASVRSQRN
jgi:hypothetical protein